MTEKSVVSQNNEKKFEFFFTKPMTSSPSPKEEELATKQNL